MAKCTNTKCKWFNQDHAGQHVTLCENGQCRDNGKYHVGQSEHVTICTDVRCTKHGTFHVGESPHEYPPE